MTGIDNEAVSLSSAGMSNPLPSGRNPLKGTAEKKPKAFRSEPEPFVPHTCRHCQKIVVKAENAFRQQKLSISIFQAHRAAKDGCEVFAMLCTLFQYSLTSRMERNYIDTIALKALKQKNTAKAWRKLSGFIRSLRPPFAYELGKDGYEERDTFLRFSCKGVYSEYFVIGAIPGKLCSARFWH